MSPEPTSSKITLSDDMDDLPAPLGRTRAEAMQRLQIGLIGLAAMILMVTLANIVMERANQTDATAVPEAVDASSGAPVADGVAKDPLADAGVVPDLPTESKADSSRERSDKRRNVP